MTPYEWFVVVPAVTTSVIWVLSIPVFAYLAIRGKL